MGLSVPSCQVAMLSASSSTGSLRPADIVPLEHVPRLAQGVRWTQEKEGRRQRRANKGGQEQSRKSAERLAEVIGTWKRHRSLSSRVSWVKKRRIIKRVGSLSRAGGSEDVRERRNSETSENLGRLAARGPATPPGNCLLGGDHPSSFSLFFPLAQQLGHAGTSRRQFGFLDDQNREAVANLKTQTTALADEVIAVQMQARLPGFIGQRRMASNS